MTEGTLRNLTRELCSLRDRDSVNFIWHGGEPLLMGVDFYREAVALQEHFKDGKLIQNSIQSNVSLVNDEFLSFSETNKINIGSSLDGPEEIHNLTRVYPDGSGTFSDVWAGLQLIRQRNLKIRKERFRDGKQRNLGGGAITILSRKNIERIDVVYDFFAMHGLSMKINPLIKSGRAIEDFEELGIGPSEYGLALVKLFDRWYHEPGEGIDVDPLSDIIGNLVTGNPIGCNFSETCRRTFVSIGPQGDVYPCGRFDGVREYRFGNINNDGLESMLNSDLSARINSRTADTVAGCSACDYKKICNAGCIHNAYLDKGDIMDKDSYCPSYKILFKHIDKEIRREVSEATIGACLSDERICK